jgi:hypothetical protein
MPTPAAEQQQSVTTSAKQVAGDASRLAKVGLEQAKRELARVAAAVGLGLGAVLLALYGLAFLLATIAAALAIVLDAWLALLLVALGLFTIAGILVLLARGRLEGKEADRRELDTAVQQLRGDLDEATDVSGTLQGRLPVLAAGALGAGFFLAGGIGATMRLLARKSRER